MSCGEVRMLDKRPVCSCEDLASTNGAHGRFAARLDDPDRECPRGRWVAIPRDENGEPISDATGMPQISVFNLIYHVYASKANDCWKANIRQLKRRIGLFNGKRVIAVAEDRNSHSWLTVKREFGMDGLDFMALPNDPRIREVVTFAPLLRKVYSVNPREATFYAHSKGNTNRTDSVKGMVYWRNAGYHFLLDDPAMIRRALQLHPCVGIHKMCWSDCIPPYPTRLSWGRWMFAGTFFWFRNEDVFSNWKWPFVPDDRYGAEAWLSGLFAPSQAHSVYQLWPEYQYPTPSPYDPSLYKDPIDDD